MDISVGGYMCRWICSFVYGNVEEIRIHDTKQEMYACWSCFVCIPATESISWTQQRTLPIIALLEIQCVCIHTSPCWLHRAAATAISPSILLTFSFHLFQYRMAVLHVYGSLFALHLDQGRFMTVVCTMFALHCTLLFINVNRYIHTYIQCDHKLKILEQKIGKNS